MSFTLDDLTFKYMNHKITPKEHIKKYGWAVVKIDNFHYNRYQKKFFDHLESCNDNFSRDDPSTWIRENLPYSSEKGIFKYYFGHTSWQWDIREKCINVFSELWNTDSLICSYDGGCFLAPQPRKKKYQNWFHTDQDRETAIEFNQNGTIRGHQVDFTTIQGVVCITPALEQDGGLVIIEKSHKNFNELLEQDPELGVKWKIFDKEIIEELPKTKVCAEAGDIILFDSRTIHCNIPPKSDQFRMCTYVSMSPRILNTKVELELHKSYYENGIMTGHNTYGGWFKAINDHPPEYSKNINPPRIIEIANISRGAYSLV